MTRVVARDRSQRPLLVVFSSILTPESAAIYHNATGLCRALLYTVLAVIENNENKKSLQERTMKRITSLLLVVCLSLATGSALADVRS